MTYETITFETAEKVAVLTLNRPTVLNSFNAKMHEELRAALRQAKDGGSRALLITGSAVRVHAGSLPVAARIAIAGNLGFFSGSIFCEPPSNPP